ncbi:hypothetical protein [Glycomyces niveus]|uniref:Uncharacterized protein n=1 Tax=Glycomyces niveus TaxID=2820287 RepID=A0ABS3U9H2_9ACTN|nr:hypothetical protein [Glycomyces sp. NEAU-S30]MBO3735420.1 hypothetical protein [Glycomyces sp. NEAU-S30]
MTDNPADLVLIVSGLNTGHLHATWGEGWRAFVPEWKDWVRDAAFQVFHTGHVGRSDGTDRPGGSTAARPIPGKVRFCNG